MRVYFRDQNPAVDHFAFKCSVARGKEKVDAGEGRYIVDGDGRTAIQLYRSQAARDDSWMARLNEIATTTQASSTSPIPFLKIKWPESVKALRAESQIPNVRSLAAAAAV